MKVIIDIPKEFEEDIKDNFQDFFGRVGTDIAYKIARSRINTDDTPLCGNYELETSEMFLDAFKNMHIIPKTNGDTMKAMYPDLEVEIEGDCVTCWIDEHRFLAFTLEWWNSPYERQKNEDRFD